MTGEKETPSDAESAATHHAAGCRQPLDGARIVELASAYYASAALFAALDCGVFAALQRAPRSSAAELARRLNLSERGLRLLLDGCVALGLLLKEGAVYDNTPAGAQMLVPGAAHDLTRAIRYNQDVYGAWGRLRDLVATGRPVERPELHLGDDPQRTRRFVLAMYGRAMGIGKSVVPLVNLQGARRLLDVGGGPAAYSMLFARAYPQLQASVIDLPAVAAVADELIAKADLGGRISTIPGSYHTTEFPPEQDAVIFFGVLHQEPGDAIVRLLRRAYAALRPGGKVCVLDMMTDVTHTQPPFAALFAINMALTTEHGWVFAREELAGWLREAGFGDIETRQAPPPMPHVLMEGRRP